jgi:predicted glycoside hydrolase/deacetylase ChbG (UPF0249 family)
MVPCPWFAEVPAYAKAHPEADLGLHLTLTAECQDYRWGPIASRALVTSLVGPDGNFYASPDDVAEHAKLNEVATEIRAQIERAKAMGIEPSHLDAHLHTLYQTPELRGAAWRQRELDAMLSPEFRKALEDNHVILIGWRDMGACNSCVLYPRKKLGLVSVHIQISQSAQDGIISSLRSAIQAPARTP